MHFERNSFNGFASTSFLGLLERIIKEVVSRLCKKMETLEYNSYKLSHLRDNCFNNVLNECIITQEKTKTMNVKE